jgi:hypothetical protein
MSDTNIQLENHGRFLLWYSALNECEHLLKLAKRAETEMHTQEALDKEDRYVRDLNIFASKQSDYTPGTMKHSHVVAFSKIQQKEFPAFTDCTCINDSLLMLAVVFFCQIFNIGHKSEGKAACNSKTFRNQHFSNILNKTFSNADDRDRFESFSAQLISARNEMIGHADGNAFNIFHGTPVTSMKHYTAAIKEIDVEYWTSILSPLRMAVLDYVNQENPYNSAGATALVVAS